MRFMPKRWAILISVVVAVLLGITDCCVINIFNALDFEGFIGCILIAPIVPLGAGIGMYFLLLRIGGKIRIGLIIIGVVVVGVLLQISIHPSITNPWLDIAEYSQIYAKYPNNINYDDLALGNPKEIVAASVKYHDSLPDKVAVIRIERYSKPYDIYGEYWAELKGGVVSYNRAEFLLSETNETVILTVRPNSPEQKIL